MKKAGARRENLPNDVQIVNLMPLNDSD